MDDIVVKITISLSCDWEENGLYDCIFRHRTYAFDSFQDSWNQGKECLYAYIRTELVTADLPQASSVCAYSSHLC